ncbi:unnamed protein product [Amoebophrya sp. A25]|nr:unnamed protein product [Amoebophrya sp. A25]|eukprot:GSA25T00004664001.1
MATTLEEDPGSPSEPDSAEQAEDSATAEFVAQLRHACEHNDLSAIKQILTERPDLVDCSVDNTERTLLMRMICRNNADMVSYLVGLGANVDTRLDIYRYNALMIAIDKRNDNLIKILMTAMDEFHPYDFDLGGECSQMVRLDPEYCSKPGAEFNMNDSTRIGIEVGLTAEGIQEALCYIDDAASRMQSKMPSRQITPRVPATPRGDESVAESHSYGAFAAAYDAGSSVGGASINTAQVVSQAVDPKRPLLALHAILLDKEGTELQRISAENSNIVKHFAPHLMPQKGLLNTEMLRQDREQARNKKKFRRSFSSASARKAKRTPRQFKAEGIAPVDFERRLAAKKLHETVLIREQGYSPRNSDDLDDMTGGDRTDTQSVVSRSAVSASGVSAVSAARTNKSAERLERDAFILEPERHKVGLFLDLYKVQPEVAAICFKLEAQPIYAEKAGLLKFFTEKPEYSVKEKEHEKGMYESERGGSERRSQKDRMSLATTMLASTDAGPHGPPETLLDMRTSFDLTNIFIVSLCREGNSREFAVPHWMAHYDWRACGSSEDQDAGPQAPVPEDRLAVQEEAIFQEITNRIHPLVCSKSFNSRRFPVLIKSVFQNNVTLMMSMLEAKAAPEIADVEYGITALGWAARRGFDLLVRKLVEQEADVNCVDFFGKTALAAAVEERKVKVVRYLLENKADANHVNPRNGETCLFSVQSVEMAKLLLSHKVDLNWKSLVNKGTALLNLASRLCAHRGQAEEVFQIIKHLVEARADVLSQDDKCISPLFAAVTNVSNANVAQLFLQQGAGVEIFAAVCGCANLNEERLFEAVDEVAAGPMESDDGDAGKGETGKSDEIVDVDLGSQIGRRNPYFDSEPLHFDNFKKLWHSCKLAEGMAELFFGILKDAFTNFGLPAEELPPIIVQPPPGEKKAASPKKGKAARPEVTKIELGPALDKKIFQSLELLLSRDTESAIDVLFDSGQLQFITMGDLVYMFQCTQVFCLGICNAFLIEDYGFCDDTAVNPDDEEEEEEEEDNNVRTQLPTEQAPGHAKTLEEMLAEADAADAAAARPHRPTEQAFQDMSREEVLTQIVGDPTGIGRKPYHVWLDEQDAKRQRERDVLTASLRPGEKLSDLFKKHGIKTEVAEPKIRDILPPLEKKAAFELVETLTQRTFGKNKLKRLDKRVGVKEFQELIESLPNLRRHMFPHWTPGGGPVGLSKAAKKHQKIARQQRGRVVETLCEERIRSDCHVM